MFKRAAVIATMAGLVIGPVVAGTASASAGTRAAQVRLTGGDTSVTTAPGIAGALLGHGIVPIATLPGTEGARVGSGGVAVRFTFPVTGGWLNAAKLRGTIWHKGGILFVAPATGKQIKVSNFVINVHQGVLTAEVNGNRLGECAVGLRAAAKGTLVTPATSVMCSRSASGPRPSGMSSETGLRSLSRSVRLG
jgi:hypothetical protein